MSEWQLIERRGLVWPEKRVLVSGPSTYTDWDTLKAVLQKFRPTMIVHGHAAGVDRLASLFAQFFHIDELRFPAQWRLYGAHAPLVRNKNMFSHGKPDLVLSFPGSCNSDDVLQRARRAQIQVVAITGADWVESLATTQAEALRVRA